MFTFYRSLKIKALGVITLSAFPFLFSCQESKLISSGPINKIEPKIFLRVKNHPSSMEPIEIKHLDSLIFLTSQSIHFSLVLPSYDDIKSKWMINDQLYSTTPNLTITTSQKYLDVPTQVSHVTVDPLNDSIRADFLIKIILNPKDTLLKTENIPSGEV
jgi:hypothetical protein